MISNKDEGGLGSGELLGAVLGLDEGDVVSLEHYPLQRLPLYFQNINNTKQ